jgi:List-Bact-rpt repeat protein
MTGTGVTWATSDAAVATIDAAGLSTAVGSGVTTITATDTTGANASTTLTVRQRPMLTVVTAGGGTGAVSSNPPGIACGADCSEAYDAGTAVTLTATASNTSDLNGWSGCDTVSGSSCTVTMNDPRAVTATFELQQFALTIARTGLGRDSGTVTSSPSGINCGADCTETYTIDTTVTLTAAPALLFTGWSGCDAVSGATCTVTMRSLRSVTASFLGIP